jgi:Ca2+-binding EF-hand superfamily protein
LRELDLSDNLIGDRACEELCEVLCAGIGIYLVGISLAHNEIGRNDRVGTALGSLITSARNLEMLDLNWNLLSGAGALEVFKGIYENNCNCHGKLRRLSVAWNRLGMRCSDESAKVQSSSDKHGDGEANNLELSKMALQANSSSCTCSICLACNNLMKTLYDIFRDGQVLFHLDLSYNGMSAEDCAVFGEGLKQNHTLFGLHLSGNGAIVDELGFIVPSPPDASQRREEKHDRANRYFENIPAKMRLDLTPHVIVQPRKALSADPLSIAPSISNVSNITGVIMPDSPSSPKSDSQPDVGLFGSYRANPSLRGLGFSTAPHPETFSNEDLEIERNWVMSRTKAQQPLEFASAPSDDVRRNATCCWICENWVEHRVSYIPGWSGPEVSPDQVFAVFAFFSIDGFSRATKLTRIEEPFQRRQFDAERGGNLRQFGKSEKKHVRVRRSTLSLGRHPLPCLTEQGRVVRWTGSRMLPPTTVPIQVIFQVNNGLTIADDMPSKDLAVPKAVKLQDVSSAGEVDGSSCSGSAHNTAQSWVKNKGGDCVSYSDGAVHAATAVNILSVGISAWERFEHGEATALLILEDPHRRDEVNVLPRRLQEVSVPRPMTAWTVDKSVFAAYISDTESIVNNCFENDWKLSRLVNILKNSSCSFADKVYNFLKDHYSALMAAHRQYAFFGFKSNGYAPGVLLIAFTDILNDYGGRAIAGDLQQEAAISSTKSTRSLSSQSGDQRARRRHAEGFMEIEPGTELFNKDFQPRDADTIFVAASVMEKTKRKGLMGMPEKGLARFQFLEAFVRVSHRRYQDTGEHEDTLTCVKALWDLTHLGQDLLELRQSLHKDLFCEECDIVYKEYYHMLQGVYTSYKGTNAYPGRQGGGLSLGAWEQLLMDADVGDAGVSVREIGAAFALGKELRPDAYTTMRHMELSWPEFLVCLGAIMRLRADFEPEFFADSLADFFADHISNARQSKLDGASVQVDQKDAELTSVLQLVSKVFIDADHDNSGSLTLREFRRAMVQPKVQQEMKEIGVSPDELNTLFSRIDSDGSGDVSLDELCEGFMKLKLSMRGVDRAIAYFRKAFSEADQDNSGTLSMYEFKELTANPRVQKRLAALGVQLPEIEVLFEHVSTKRNPSGGGVGNLEGMSLTADDMIAGFLAIRENGLGESRGVNFLRQVFLEADADGGGSLSRQEVRNTFCTERVSHKLQRLHLREPDWMAVFDALDVDGNGTISWTELQQGVCQMWKEDMDDNIRRRSQAQVAKATGTDKPSKTPKQSMVQLEAAAKFTAAKLPGPSKVRFGREEAGVKSTGLGVSASAETITPAASAQSLPEAHLNTSG